MSNVLIKTRQGMYVNLNNVFAIDYHIDDEDVGTVFAYPPVLLKESTTFEVELFRGNEKQTREWLELFEYVCDQEGVNVIDLTSAATQTDDED